MKQQTKFNNFPDLAKSFEKMKLDDMLREKLSNNKDVISATIVNGLQSDMFSRTIEMIKEMYQDNKRIMNDTVGENLMQQILNF